jgi:hypothetical protein
VDRRFVLGEVQKQKFFDLTREYEFFCGVTCVTHSIMDNHFHLVVLVPKAPTIPLTDEELLTRIESLSGTAGGKSVRQQLQRFRELDQHEAAEALRQKFLVRMWDVSQFMKTLQQRFTQFFNKTHERTGRLWESRFKSVLVEGAGEALLSVASYVDINSIRAHIVGDPMHYKWCGYGRAMRGDKKAQEGLRLIMAGALRIAPEQLTIEEAMRLYRIELFKRGAQPQGTDEQGRPLCYGFNPEEAMDMILLKRTVPLSEYIQLRVRYFADGLVLGSREFVESVFQAYRLRFGLKRKTGARRMRGVSSDLYVLRDLKRDVIGWRGKARWREGFAGVAAGAAASARPVTGADGAVTGASPSSG